MTFFISWTGWLWFATPRPRSFKKIARRSSNYSNDKVISVPGRVETGPGSCLGRDWSVSGCVLVTGCPMSRWSQYPPSLNWPPNELNAVRLDTEAAPMLGNWDLRDWGGLSKVPESKFPFPSSDLTLRDLGLGLWTWARKNVEHFQLSKVTERMSQCLIQHWPSNFEETPMSIIHVQREGWHLFRKFHIRCMMNAKDFSSVESIQINVKYKTWLHRANVHKFKQPRDLFEKKISSA